MDIFLQKSKIVITCHKWLSPYVQQEVTQLGFDIDSTFQTGLMLTGTLQDCIKLNLHLQCASQVLYSLKAFECHHPDELYEALVDMQWHQFINADSYFSITSHVYHDSVNNSLYANVRVKDAIVDAMRDMGLDRPTSGPMRDKTVFHLHWKNEDAEIFIDTSGETLAKHGYRKLPGKAPMLEALACATIMAGTWDCNSAFVNPMCGSGTLAIEAALLASNRPSSLLRDNYAFMHLLSYDPTFYNAEMQLIKSKVKNNLDFKIIASDYSAKAIDIAKQNAEYANVAHLIDFEVCDFSKTTMPENNKGVVYINPEYGERLGDEEKLVETYSAMGDYFKQSCKGYTGFIFTGNANLAKKIGLKATRKIEFVNGSIECRLLRFEIYEGTKRVLPVTENIPE
jgi:putative N6-adenine-specific DNA methylase